MSNMELGRAVQIFHIINNDYSDLQEKGEAIEMVLSMETKNSISKAACFRVIRWLWGLVYEEQAQDAALEEIKNDLVDNMAAYIQLNGIKALMELVMDAINTVQGAKNDN